MATEGKGKIQDGVRVRFVEVPVKSRALGGVFDLLDKTLSRDEKTRLARSTLLALTKACAEQQGQVLRKWLKIIIRDVDKAERYISRSMAEYMKIVADDDLGPLELRHADRFAFIYGCAKYAIQTDILPWKHRQLLEAVLKCNRASRETIPSDVDPVKEGREMVVAAMRDKARMINAEDVRDAKSIDGWRVKSQHYTTYYMFGDRWRGLFQSTKQRKAVERHYIDRGILLKSADGKITHQKTLPNSSVKAPRCIVLRANRK